MNKNTVKVLGIGASFNDGLHYNSFLVNENFLVECPPDIIVTLKKVYEANKKLKYIFISHLHGDHYFGFPFLVLDLFYNNVRHPIKVIGPENLKKSVYSLFEIAFSKEHKALNWMSQYLNFIILAKSNPTFKTQSFSMSFFKLDHLDLKCFGFLYHSNSSSLGYIADTKWCDSVRQIFKAKPNVVITDLLGVEKRFCKNHLSYDQIIEGIKISRDHTKVYATHLKKIVNFNNDQIITLTTGAKIYF